MLYKKGETIEVGYGEYDEGTEEVEDGGSYFIQIDVDEIDEDSIVKIFSRHDNVLYVQKTTDPQSLDWARENDPISVFLKKYYGENR